MLGIRTGTNDIIWALLGKRSWQFDSNDFSIPSSELHRIETLFEHGWGGTVRLGGLVGDALQVVVRDDVHIPIEKEFREVDEIEICFCCNGAGLSFLRCIDIDEGT